MYVMQGTQETLEVPGQTKINLKSWAIILDVVKRLPKVTRGKKRGKAPPPEPALDIWKDHICQHPLFRRRARGIKGDCGLEKYIRVALQRCYTAEHYRDLDRTARKKEKREDLSS